MEYPRDYSSMYCEGDRPVPQTRKIHKSEGGYSQPMHRESTVDLRAVVRKLQQLPQETNQRYAIDALNTHYSSVFQARREVEFKVFINYIEENTTYVVRTKKNTLRAFKDKLPRRGYFRFFFQVESSWEEIESDNQELPYQEKNGHKEIYCQVFKQ